MNQALVDLIKISRDTGADPKLVQGGGGNTSVKTDDGKYMYIKASGTALKDMSVKVGWRRLRLEATLSVLKDEEIAHMPPRERELKVVDRLLDACDDNVRVEARPSVEAPLHACLEKCVIHLHPSAVGAFVNAKNGWAKLQKLFKDEKLPPLWVPYPYPDAGYVFAKRLARIVDAYKKQHDKGPAILFLEKHGLFIAAPNATAALRLVRRVIKQCNSKLRHPKAREIKTVSQKTINDIKHCIRNAFFKATGEYAVISYFSNHEISDFMTQRDAEEMLSAGVLTPDELVYTNGPAMWVDRIELGGIAKRLKQQIKKGEKHSVAFLVKNVGLFVAGEKKMAQTVRDIVAYSAFIRGNAKRMGGICSLNKRERDFINKWESEAFRKSIASASTTGDLQNRIAVVTGAGSGLGRSIAIGLARAGAIVGLTDIDRKAADSTKEMIIKELPKAQAAVYSCDVTNENNVKKTFEAILENWGGLDILVNAAGLAPAYPLVDMPVDKWRAALEVNLTGYLLMARETARIMIRQGMGGNIINLSSKSGLDASKNNTAYNATKAGEIHMARGWALELGEYGIRVNSIAAGNVFEGSKIWNPQYIKVCAKKYGIKPEEVIQYYVDKTALKREIKGQDVADCVVFLCSDKAQTITGQTLVADSGQVMVR